MALIFSRSQSGALVRYDLDKLPKYKKQNETEVGILAILESAHIYTIAQSAGFGLVRDGWQCDGWQFTFERGDKRAKNAVSETFDFFTGIGHRHGPKNNKLVSPSPTLPHVASVLHSLILDSQAARESFPEWCANYGYSDDSINALETYRACIKNAEKLARVFPREILASIAEKLQDY